MTSEFGWRRFGFFTPSVIFSKENPKEKFSGLKDVAVDCWCSSGGSVYLGEAKGGVFQLTNQFGEYYWKAYQKSLASLHSADKYLFSIGEDDDTVNTLLKIWDPERVEKNTPHVMRTIRMSPLNPTSSSPACSIAVHSSLHAVVVGYTDGTVLFYHGDVLHDKALNSRWVKVRDSSVGEGAVTGLAIATLPASKTVVFVITQKHVYSYVLENNKTVVAHKKHDANGATADCWTFDESTGQLIVASREMLFFYDADQCIDVDGEVGRCLQLGRGFEKLQLVACGQYLALLTKHHAVIQKAEFMTMLTVYDVKGQYIGFSCSLPELCRLFVAGNTMLVLSHDGILSELVEKNLATKLDILFKKNLFDVAVLIAKNSRDGSDYLKGIHAKYGDYLYGKGDYENAIQQYKDTIGMLEPSYVMKRYLDSSKIKELCIYLECLHDAKKDNEHQTKILMNAYAKQGEKKKLMEFVNKIIDGSRSSRMRDVFEILLKWNYLPEASLLATKFAMHEDALNVIIHHMHKYTMGVTYISKMPIEDVIEMAGKFGRDLLIHAREDLMHVLWEQIRANTDSKNNFMRLFDIFMGDMDASQLFLSYVLNQTNGEEQDQYINLILEYHMRSFKSQEWSEERLNDDIFRYIHKKNEDVVLQMAQLFDCTPVIEHILMKSHRAKELMLYHHKKKDLDAIIKLCQRSSPEEKNRLWLDALTFIGKNATADDEQVIIDLLEEIEASEAVHPLVVLELLSKNEHLTISSVKDYVIAWLRKQQIIIDDDRKTIEENEKSMEELDSTVESLKFNAQVMQVSKCSACDTPLQLPTVHFLCKHAYHVHCFDSYTDGSDKCPACQTTWPNIANEEISYHKFQKELSDAPNVMELIAMYLQKGLFDEKKKTRKSEPLRENSGGLQRAVSSNTNPFDDDDAATTISRTMSTASSNMAPAYRQRSTTNRKDDNSTNPFFNSDASSSSKKNSYDESKNPFGEPSKSNNPFD
uniref:Vacuolar protein sorting-associated protein 11 homolog n=1 Tax=Caenorhabditis japonica TaxID=281687 RepID=A0A8R1I1T3_CAEJA